MNMTPPQMYVFLAPGVCLGYSSPTPPPPDAGSVSGLWVRGPVGGDIAEVTPADRCLGSVSMITAVGQLFGFLMPHHYVEIDP